MRLPEGNPFKTCGNPHACDQKINRANVYENEMVKTYRDLNCSGAALKESREGGKHCLQRQRPSAWSELAAMQAIQKELHQFPQTSETGRIWSQRVRFQTLSSVSFLALNELRGENSVSSSQPIICVHRRTHRVLAEPTEFAPKLSEAQWVLFSETVLSKQYSTRFLMLRRVLRRFFNNKCFLEGFSEGSCKGFK